jgi:hypothetical protein
MWLPGQEDQEQLMVKWLPGQEDQEQLMVKWLPGQEDQEQLMVKWLPGQEDQEHAADETMAEAVAPLEDEMVKRVRPEAGKLLGEELHWEELLGEELHWEELLDEELHWEELLGEELHRLPVAGWKGRTWNRGRQLTGSRAGLCRKRLVWSDEDWRCWAAGGFCVPHQGAVQGKKACRRVANQHVATARSRSCSAPSAAERRGDEDEDDERVKKIQQLHAACCKWRVTTVAAKKKVGAERCEYVFDVHVGKASKRLKLVLLYPWRANVKTTGGFYCMSFPDFLIDKTAPYYYNLYKQCR